MATCSTCLDLNKQYIKSWIDQNEESFCITWEALQDCESKRCIKCLVLQDTLLHFSPSWRDGFDFRPGIEQLVCYLVDDDEYEHNNVWLLEVFTYYKRGADGRGQAPEQLKLDLSTLGGISTFNYCLFSRWVSLFSFIFAVWINAMIHKWFNLLLLTFRPLQGSVFSL